MPETSPSGKMSKRGVGAKFEFGKFSRKGILSILASNKRINIWEGSVRSGKTICSLVRWIEYVKKAPPGLLLLVGKTERTIKRNIIDTLAQMVGEENISQVGDTVWMFGREIALVSAYDERSEQRIRGMTIAGAYGDEITLWPSGFFSMLMSRMSVRGAKFFGTTNPDSPFHWLKVNYLDRDVKSLARFSFSIDDNPNLDPEFVEALKSEYTGLFYKRFIQGLWVQAEGVVYDMWDDSKHVVDTKDVLAKMGRARFDYYAVSVDYGTCNPCTFGLYGWNRGSAVYLVKEYYYNSNVTGRQKTDAEYADDFVMFLEGIKPTAIYVDPSALSFITELSKPAPNRGFMIQPADNSVIDGIRFCSAFLARGKFFVDRSCIETIKEFGAYMWDSRASRVGEDRPIKENDHCMDRNRYLLYSHFYSQYPTFYAGYKY